MAYNPTPLDTSATSEQLIFEGGNRINTNFQEILTWMNEKQSEVDAVEIKNTQQDQEISDLQIYLQEQQEEINAVEIKNTQQDQEIFDLQTSLQDQQDEINAVEIKNTQQDQEISDLQTSLEEQQNVVPDPTGVGAFAMAVNLTTADIGYEEEVHGSNLCPVNTYSVVNTDGNFTFTDLTEVPFQQRLSGTWVSVTSVVPTQVTVEAETAGEWVHTWSSGLFMRVD